MPIGSAITFSLKSCTELENSQLGREIHADPFKFGLNGDGFVDHRSYDGIQKMGIFTVYKCVMK